MAGRNGGHLRPQHPLEPRWKVLLLALDGLARRLSPPHVCQTAQATLTQISITYHQNHEHPTKHMSRLSAVRTYAELARSRQLHLSQLQGCLGASGSQEGFLVVLGQSDPNVHGCRAQAKGASVYGQEGDSIDICQIRRLVFRGRYQLQSAARPQDHAGRWAMRNKKVERNLVAILLIGRKIQTGKASAGEW